MLVVILVLATRGGGAVADVHRVGTGRGGGGDHWSQSSSVGGDVDAVGSGRVCNCFRPLPTRLLLTVEESVPAVTAAAIARFKALIVLPPEPAVKTNVPPVAESVMVTVVFGRQMRC